MKVYFTLFLLLSIEPNYGQVTNLNVGVWSDHTLWSNNNIPTDTTNIILNYSITVDINGYCKSLNTNGHNVTINSGLHLYIGKTPTQGNIIYTNVNPDSIMATNPAQLSSTYNLDLNNDDINDYSLTLTFNPNRACGRAECYILGASYLTITSLGNNFVLNDLNDLLTYPTPLNLNDSINPISNTWNPDPSNIFSGGGNSCCPQDGWIGLEINQPIEKYIGLKLIKDTHTYYGWMLLQVTTFSKFASFIIKEYAYNSIPDASILAGQIK